MPIAIPLLDDFEEVYGNQRVLNATEVHKANEPPRSASPAVAADRDISFPSPALSPLFSRLVIMMSAIRALGKRVKRRPAFAIHPALASGRRGHSRLREDLLFGITRQAWATGGDDR